MNAYDFDKTIHRGDSSLAFYRFCLLRRPHIALLWPVQIAAFLLHALHLLDKTGMKQLFYLYFRLLDAEQLAERFWQQRGISRIFDWYLQQRQPDDLIVSASPEFFLAPICRRLGLSVFIASQVDSRTGRCLSPNCTGEEKVRRILALFPNAQFERCYYDSDSDLPMAALAKRRFRVTRGVPVEE